MDKITGKLSVLRTVTGRLSTIQTLNGRLSVPEVIDSKRYEGSYVFTPTQEAQTIKTEGLKMMRDVVISPIPQNYGLVTYNGAVITVS